jgi:hypothetical protein
MLASCTPTATTDAGTDAGDGGFCGIVACEQCTTSAMAASDGGDGGDADAAVATGYTLTIQGKPTAMLNACTPAALQAFVTACFSVGATTATCAAWNAEDAGAAQALCAACLAPTAPTSPTWGPFVCATASPCNANSGGCADIVLGTIGAEIGQNSPDAGVVGSCGDAITNAVGCEDYTCDLCLNADFTTCLSDAVSNQCQLYEAQRATLCPANDAGPPAFASCFPQTNGENNAENFAFVNVFCGTGP